MASRGSKAKRRGKSRAAKRVKSRRETNMEQRASSSSTEALAGLKPSPATGESIEDLAVFTKASREQLSSELQLQADAIGNALEQVYEGDFDRAMEGLKSIPRGSPYADWRLFVRGLISHYAGGLENARENWQRLDLARRPARIASTLLLAEGQPPLGEKVPQGEQVPPGQQVPQGELKIVRPPKLVAAAKELRYRPRMIAAAQRIAAVKHRDPERAFSASQVAMLKEFRNEYRALDRDFVEKLSQACVQLSYFQPMSEIFELLKNSIPGPPHDPAWNLFGISYYSQFSGDEGPLGKCSQAYLNIDLPRQSQMPDALKGALASSILLMQAERNIQSELERRLPFSFMNDPVDPNQVEPLLMEAIKKYALNRAAHQRLIDVLQMRLEDDRNLSKPAEKAIQNRIVKAKAGLVKAFPDEVETALWLIDHYFDEDQLEQANSLVKKLGEQRLDAPLAKALHWKLKLLEAMRLSRRKTSLAASRDALSAAEATWPKWLGTDWLPLLKAAIEMRAGDRAKYERLIATATEGSSASEVARDVMTFAALQQMNLPSADLKPFRERVDRHALNAKSLPINDLCRLGSFFWNLCRTGLQYKAYRLQASKFGKALCNRIKDGEPVEMDGVFLDACSWAACHGFWKSDYFRQPPQWIATISRREPKVAAAVLEWILGGPMSSRKVTEIQPLIALLQASARTENDPFYRHRFDKIAKDALSSAAELEAENRNSKFNSFANFGWDDDDEDDDSDDDDSSDFCDCPACRARRARGTASGSRAKPQSASPRPSASRSQFEFYSDEDEDEFEEFLDDDEDDDDDDDFDPLADEIPPIFKKVFLKLGPERVGELMAMIGQMSGPMAKTSNSFESLNPIMELLHRAGLSASDAAEFLLACQQSSARMDSSNEFTPPLPTAKPMSAQERREMLKKRRKELQKKRKERR